MTELEPVPVESSWWTLDIDVELAQVSEASVTDWRPFALARLCARFGSSEQPRGGFCQIFDPPGNATFDYLLDEDGPELPWVDDAGTPSVPVYFSPRARRWLRDQPPTFFDEVPQVLGDYTALQAFFDGLDDPLTRLRSSWSYRGPISTVVDPMFPSVRLPEAYHGKLLDGAREVPGPVLYGLLVVPVLLSFMSATSLAVERPLKLAVLLVMLALLPFSAPLLMQVPSPVGTTLEALAHLTERQLLGLAPLELTTDVWGADTERELDELALETWQLTDSRDAVLIETFELQAPPEISPEFSVEAATGVSSAAEIDSRRADERRFPSSSQLVFPENTAIDVLSRRVQLGLSRMTDDQLEELLAELTWRAQNDLFPLERVMVQPLADLVLDENRGPGPRQLANELLLAIADGYVALGDDGYWGPRLHHVFGPLLEHPTPSVRRAAELALSN